jgi:hypothetical protein
LFIVFLAGMLIGIASENQGVLGVSLCLGAFGVGALIFGIFLAVVAKPIYFVYLSGNSGEARILESRDRQKADAIVDAVNRAITQRGAGMNVTINP